MLKRPVETDKITNRIINLIHKGTKSLPWVMSKSVETIINNGAP